MRFLLEPKTGPEERKIKIDCPFCAERVVIGFRENGKAHVVATSFNAEYIFIICPECDENYPVAKLEKGDVIMD